MKQRLIGLFIGLTLCVLLLPNLSKAQVTNPHQSDFNLAYQQYPAIPRGVLEAVSFTQTHFRHLGIFEEESCAGLPKAYGLMGLIQDGKGYFRENLGHISQLSGYSEDDIIHDPTTHVLAYAAAYNSVLNTLPGSSGMGIHLITLSALSEIPLDHQPGNDFALNSHLYGIFAFLNNSEYQTFYGFPDHGIDMEALFGEENLRVLSSSKVFISQNGIQDVDGNSYQVNRSNEYPPAIWTPAPSCNYSSRSGTPISAITIHTIQGSYAGAISWSQNCASNVSFHYVIRSSDGQVTQMVLEADKGWHVGSENPYTIGYEHEGYVSDPSWYTTAMYNSSADLSKDVTQSGYGINPLRTYYGAASSGSNVLGSCTKIKGHQHYPNQTHTDPGINWDWERYYKLINDNPPVTNYTSGSGSFYDSGGPTGNYSDDERETFLISPVGAGSVTINFTTFDLETNWDYMYIYDGATTDDPLIGIYTGSTNPGNITSTGPNLLLEFRSDCSTNNAGWEVNWTSGAGSGSSIDSIAPVTDLTLPSSWVTTDFLTTYSDSDNTGGSGIQHQFYQVIDFDGTEWRANDDNGFFSDNFDAAVHPDWISVVGTWGISNQVLLQSDESEGNTNLYAQMDQNNENSYLYHWSGAISGSGSNKRAGFHFMCSSGSMTNRGDSYFVWFRSDNNKIQIYKTVNDVFSLEADVPFTINDGQWYDFKVVYDKTTGTIDVWVDNEHSASWTDPSPYTTGSFISFRSGDAQYEVNNLKIYKERGTSTIVTVGSGNDIRYQNQNPLTPSGRVKSITIDSANNVSSIDFMDVNVDWTAPADVALVGDGYTTDIDTFYNNTEITANWSLSADIHSDIARYWYAIGTSAGATDIVNWTDNWFYDSLTHSGLSLTYGTTYFVSVRAENGAGLLANPISSDGQYLDLPTAPPDAAFTIPTTFICAGDSIQLSNGSSNASTYAWTVSGATLSSATDPNPYVVFPASGSYTIVLTATGPGGSDMDSTTVNISIDQPPIADFSASDTIVYLPSAFVGFTNQSSNANGYFWDFGDGNTSSDVNPWHIYNTQGTYQVMLIAVNGTCPNDTTYITVEVPGVTDIQDQASDGIYVFPNPVTSTAVVWFTYASDDSGVLEFYDVSGRVVRTESVPAGTDRMVLNLENLASGTYTLRLRSDDRLQSFRLIKH